MTKEPIMIDDVNVSECEEHYLNKYNEHMCCDYKTSDCSHCKPKQKQCYFYVESIENKLKHKEQECEELKKELHKNFEEKDKLHLIIDRLLEASGYDTNIASVEDFEDVYANMSYEKLQLDQLKEQLQAEKEKVRGLEAEKEVIKSYLGISHKTILERLDELYERRLETEEELEKYKELAKSFEADFYNALSDKESNYVKKLKQALQEIKQIAEDECKNCTVKLLGEDKINCKRCYKTKILQKCEVLND